MFDFIAKTLSTLLGADFPKVAGLCGLLLVMLGVMPGTIRLGPVVIPRRDTAGRSFAIFLGTIFVMVPLLSLHFGSTIGFINLGTAAPMPSTEPPASEPPARSSLIGTAYAAQGTTYSLPQRSVVDVSASVGPNVAVYVADVHLSDPTMIVLFKSDSPGAAQIGNGGSDTESAIRRLLPPGDLILLGSFKQGDRRTFSYNGANYVFRVEQIVWFLIGSDSVTISITPQ